MRKPEGIWFGSRDRPLAGFLHRPVGVPVGGVLLCAPFGYESTCAHRTLRRLADCLADRGELVLRFDYPGSGASSGSGLEPDLLDRWQASVSAGLAELRALGVRRPAIFGMRLGAALACGAASRELDVGPLALWAPVTSGRRYYRELRAQAAATPGGAPGDGSLNVFGHVLPGDAAKALKSWDPLDGIGPRSKILVVQSSNSRDVREAESNFVQAGLRPTLLEIDGTSAVIGRDAERVVVPVPLVEAICRWLVARTRDQGPAVGCRSSISEHMRSIRQHTRVVEGAEGPVEEEIVNVPPDGLYGVLTRPTDHRTTTGIVFLNNGVAPAAGPARAWVEFGRSLAVSGICSLRLDFSGLGDSPDQPRRSVSRDRAVPPTAGQELLAAVDYLRGRGIHRVIVVGLCSGAHIAVRTAAYGGQIDAVFAVNATLYRLIDMGIGPWMRRLWKLTAFPLSKRPVRNTLHRLPERAWTMLDRLGIFPSPARYLRRAAQRGTFVHLVFGDSDKALEDLRIRAGHAVDELVSAGEISLDVIRGMDHSMFDRGRRAVVLDMLRKACLVPSPPPLDGGPCR